MMQKILFNYLLIAWFLSFDRPTLLGYVSFYWATVCKTVRALCAIRPLSVLSVTLVYCGWISNDATCYGGRTRPRHIFADGIH